MKLFRLPRKIAFNAIFIYVALFCVSTYALLEHTNIAIPAFSSIKSPLVLIGMICLATQFRTIFRCILKKHYFYMLLSLFVFFALLAISIVANRHTTMGFSPFRYTFRMIMYCMEVFVLTLVLAETGRGSAALTFLFWYVLGIVIVNDALLWTRAVSFGASRFERFLVGTKFSVSYSHMNLLALGVIRGKWNLRKNLWGKLLILLAAFYLVLLSIRVDCMTGIIGCVVLVVLLYLLNSPRRKRMMWLTTPQMLVLALAASVIFVFVVDGILQLPFVEYLVEDVFDRDITITGRTNIYGMYTRIMADRIWTGVGYGNGNSAAVALFGYENVQNALLQWVLQVGIPATIGLVLVLAQVFSQISRKNPQNMDKILPLVALIYVYIILGTVETTFNMAFILWLALIFMLVNEKKKVPLNRAAIMNRMEQAV